MCLSRYTSMHGCVHAHISELDLQMRRHKKHQQDVIYLRKCYWRIQLGKFPAHSHMTPIKHKGNTCREGNLLLHNVTDDCKAGHKPRGHMQISSFFSLDM